MLGPYCSPLPVVQGSDKYGGRKPMATLKIYGVPRSRAFRTLWLAKELSLD